MNDVEMQNFRAKFVRSLKWQAPLLACLPILLIGEQWWLRDKIIQKYHAHPVLVIINTVGVGCAAVMCAMAAVIAIKTRCGTIDHMGLVENWSQQKQAE